MSLVQSTLNSSKPMFIKEAMMIFAYVGKKIYALHWNKQIRIWLRKPLMLCDLRLLYHMQLVLLQPRRGLFLFAQLVTQLWASILQFILLDVVWWKHIFIFHESQLINEASILPVSKKWGINEKWELLIYLFVHLFSFAGKAKISCWKRLTVVCSFLQL